MAIIDIQNLVRAEDLLVDGSSGQIGWSPGRLTSMMINDQGYLVMGGGHPGGIGVATFASNGRLDFVDAYATAFSPLMSAKLSGQGVLAHEIDGTTYVYSTGSYSVGNFGSNYGISVLSFADPDDPQLLEQIRDAYALGEPGINGGSDPVIIAKGARDFLVVSGGYQGNDGLHSYRIRDDGTLGPLKISATSTNLSDGYTTAEVGNASFIVSFGSYDIAPMQVLKMNARGVFKPVYDLPAYESAIFNQQTKGIVSAEVGGRTYVFASEVTRGAILAFELKKSGELSLVDKIFPGVGDQWGYAEGLETFEQAGETYILSGGYGRSVAVFKVSDGGTLFEVDEFVMETPGLGRVADIEVMQFGAETYFAVTTTASAPLTSYRFVATDAPIVGGSGNNRMMGTDADDQILGGKGNDKVFGAAGDDLIEGGDGNDRLFGQDGADDIFGGAGDDMIDGGSGDEFIFGEAGNDVLKGGIGHDFIKGGAGQDRILGQDGNDRLFGGAERDVLKGGSGNDQLTDGAGKSDRLSGNAGSDIFIFVDDGKRDVIVDYEDGIDKIDLRAEGPLLFTDLGIRAVGTGLLVTYGNDSIKINSMDGEIFDYELNASDFLFQ